MSISYLSVNLTLSPIDSEPPVTPETSRTRLAIVLAAAVLIGGGALHAHLTRSRGLAGLTPGVLPACDSPTTRRLLKQTLEQAPASRAAGLTVLRLGVLRHHLESVRDATGLEVRVCEAEVFANAGRRTLGVSLEWTDGDRREVWLSVPQLPW